jgi:hypothetical protein
MPQHFPLTSAARRLSLASVMRMSDEEAERVFVRLRWSDNGVNAYCPHCGCPTVYSCRRPNGGAALAVQGVPEGFLGYERDAFRPS